MGAKSKSNNKPPTETAAGAGEVAPGTPGEPGKDAAGLCDDSKVRNGETLVVGMGGSAGSLEPLKTFFKSMPVDSGAAFVVIQHLAPGHESLLPEILAGFTRMKVIQAGDGQRVEPNCVYIIAPDHHLGIREEVLFFADPPKLEGVRMPIDYFFNSLAECRQERSVGILLSGAGSDGTLGARAIRGCGGMVMAQDPKTAQFRDMPQSAIIVGAVDHILSVDRMPETLVNYLRHPYVHGGRRAEMSKADEQPCGVREILALVHAQTGTHFGCYKKSTVVRRIERRMGLHGIQNMAQYGRMLDRDPEEVKHLLRDLLINVTAFFRDADAFEELKEKAIAPLVHAKPANEPLRVWVPGCASGEEAYSVAMLLMEDLTATGKNCPVQVFATDIDEESLAFARLAVYPESIAADVGPERLSRHFISKPRGFQIQPALRRLVTFAAQNLLTDPPFTRMDLICCRNLLIYLDADMQAKLMLLFNFALNPGGFLFLGKSETICGHNGMFETVSKKARLYRNLTASWPAMIHSPIAPGTRKPVLAGRPDPGAPQAADYGETLRRAILSQYAACVVLVDAQGLFLQFHGQTGKYLDMPATSPIFNLLALAKKGLAAKLRLALRQAIRENKTVVVDRAPITGPEDTSFARMSVVPVPQPRDAAPLLAVFFEDVQERDGRSVNLVQATDRDMVVKQLEDELDATQQDLQSSIEELQAANEELRIANEEVTSANEELQSTNEELETSTEELQSTNEELTTVNSELQFKIDLLDTAHNDMSNLLKASDIATLFMDNTLRIKFFTPAMTQLLNMIPSDMDRPITHLAMSFLGDFLASDARKSARDGSIVERTVRHADGRHFLMRMMPYRTQENSVEGVVVTLSDVTLLRREEERIQASLREKEALLREIHHRVKNNLQVISSLMNLQAGGVEDPALRGLFQDVSDRVRSMALVHEKLYQSRDLSQVDFGEYARGLLNNLWLSHASPGCAVQLTLDLQPVSLPVETAMPCGLILNELATNALKHAFRGRSEGEVTVALRGGEDGGVRLNVRDNGIGLPSGFETRQSPSLGLKLVHMLAGQINGIVEVNSDGGTEFVISFGPQEAPRKEA